MKLSILKSEVSVPKSIKMFALILAILDPMYSGDREHIIRQLVRYYQVTL